MTINIQGSGHMHFSGTGTDDVSFGRSLTQLYLTTGTSTTMSFDGGNTFMALADSTTHIFPYPHVKALFFTGGTWSGVGIAV